MCHISLLGVSSSSQVVPTISKLYEFNPPHDQWVAKEATGRKRRETLVDRIRRKCGLFFSGLSCQSILLKSFKVNTLTGGVTTDKVKPPVPKYLSK